MHLTNIHRSWKTRSVIPLVSGLILLVTGPVGADPAGSTTIRSQPSLLVPGKPVHSRGASKTGIEARLFRTGRRHQQLAKSADTAEERKKLLLKALAAYRKALHLSPANTALLNNLSQILVSLERFDEAEEHFLRALENEDDKAAFVAFNYARMLQSLGRADDALEYARVAANLRPGNGKIHELVLSLLLSNKPRRLPGYLLSRLQQGYEQQVLVDCIQALESKRGSRSTRYRLLNVLAQGLAATPGNPRDFTRTPAAKRLDELARGNNLEAGVHELLAVLHGDFSKSPVWWKRRGKFMTSALVQLSGRIGRYLMDHAQDTGQAEAYFRLALELGGEAPDPEAFIDLAELYANSGRDGQLDELSAEFEERLFRGKGVAIANTNLDKVYRFHLALGYMYAHLKQWENPRAPVASAEFQLERAVKIAKRLNL